MDDNKTLRLFTFCIDKATHHADVESNEIDPMVLVNKNFLTPSGAARGIFTSPCAPKDEEILHNERP